MIQERAMMVEGERKCIWRSISDTVLEGLSLDLLVMYFYYN
jgi:hypothetical protein